MAGTIGLTPAGHYLDDLLTKNNPIYKGKLCKFIKNFTIKSHRIRNLLQSVENKDDAYMLLNYMKLDYYNHFDIKFKNIVNELEYVLVRKYIKALTRLNFKPR